MKLCKSDIKDIHEEPLWKGFTFHHFGLFLCAVFGGIALIIGLTLIFLHATHYLKPWEQRHIIRILLLIPIYSTVSFLSYYFYQHAVYYDVLEGCYEAFAISSFFTLLCHYIAPNLHEQKEYFRTLKPVNWFWGVFGLQYITGGQNKGPFRKPRSGLTWFNVVWIGVFQYCFIRVLFTIVAVLTEYFDVYCEDSLSPMYAHVWVQVFEAVSVTIAMFCLIQFYIQLKDDLSEHKPFLKVLCIKLVIFFSFWQSIVISFLSSDSGPLQPGPRVSYPDIKVGIPSVLLCGEMAIFAVMHIFAFPWKGYSIKHAYADPINVPGTGFSTTVPAADRYTEQGRELGQDLKYKGGFMGWKAIADAFNPWDIIKMTARGFRWLFVGARYRHSDSSYEDSSTKMQGMGWDGAESARNGGASRQQSEARGRSDTAGTVGTVDDDHAALLANQRLPSRSPYRTGTQDSQDSDPGPPPPVPHHVGARDFGRSPPRAFEQDTGYYPVAGAGELPAQEVHPAFRQRQEQNLEAHRQEGQGWDVFGGATGSGSQQGMARARDRDEYHPGYGPGAGVGGQADAESIRPPPSYRTYDPRRPG